ncbi:MAG: metal-dependent hydrolase [Mucilaginibacter polytrichastri]|nr:metal-dependent hydrolase [Mucilaginibacter polytrichastri]
MKVTYYGQSCVQVEANGKTLLFDPFITPNELAKHIDISTLKPDFILLTHGHGDHVADAPAIAKQSGATVIAVVEMQAWLNENGVDKVEVINFGGKRVFDFGSAKFVNAIHTSSTPDGKYAGQPGGFMIDSGTETFYHAGDTALTYDMKLLANDNLKFAFLPIGDFFTMGIDDAIKAAEFINCKNIVGIHYDTFPPIKIDREEALSKFRAAGLTLHLPAIGETIDL